MSEKTEGKQTEVNNEVCELSCIIAYINWGSIKTQGHMMRMGKSDSELGEEN